MGRWSEWPSARPLIDGLKLLLPALAYLCISTACAGVLVGRVVGIADGDTITVLDADSNPHKVRLAGLDAPEKAKAFGERAKQHLSDRVFDQSVQVTFGKSDRYGRLVGKVIPDGEDVNLQMVREGLAWHYKAYEGEQPAWDRLTYSMAEDVARRRQIGLWSDAERIPLWEWRAHKRQSGH
jgi:endonuclease YncB( thermonuclease family)